MTSTHDEHGNDTAHPLYGGAKVPKDYEPFGAKREKKDTGDMPAWLAKEVERMFG